MSKAIVLYLHVHQPYRIRHYTVFDSGSRQDYFDSDYEDNDYNWCESNYRDDTWGSQ